MPVRIFEYQFARELVPLLREAADVRERRQYFVVPGTGDRRWLRDVLVGEGTFGGGEPQILRWEELYREAAARMDSRGLSPRRQIAPPDHWLIVGHILEEVLENLSPENLPPAIARPGFISILGETLRELLREEVLPEHVAASVGCEGCESGEACPEDGNPDRLLCRLYHRYAAYLESEGLFDSAQAATVIRRMVEDHPKEAFSWLSSASFVFTGFLSFTHGQLLLLRCLHDAGARLLVLTPATGLDIHNASQQLETVLEEIPVFKCHRPLCVLELESGDQRLEIEHLVRNLVLWEKAEGPFAEAAGPFPGWGDTAIAVDANRLLLAEEILERYKVPCFVDDGPNVSSTPLWETASRLWDLNRRDFPAEDTARLLTEPFLTGHAFPFRTAIETLPSGKKGWEDFLATEGPDSLPVFKGLLSFIETVESGGTPAELLEAFKSMTAPYGMHRGGWDRALSDLVLEEPDLDEGVRRLSGAVRELEQKALELREAEPDIGPAGRRKLAGDRAMAFLRAWAERSTIWQTARKTGSLTLYSGNPPVLAHHRVFVFAGALASAWPGRLRQSPLLPDEKRELLHQDPSLELGAFHLPLLSEIRRQRHALFRRILACGDELTIVSRPRQDASGRPLQLSPFLRDAREGDAPWITPLQDEPVRTTMKDVLPENSGTRIRPVEVREAEKPLVPRRLTGEIQSLEKRDPASSPTAYLGDIDLWRTCPFRYYAMRILGLQEPRPGLFDAARAGSMIHDLWNKAWLEKKKTGRNLTEIVDGIWKKTVLQKYPELLREGSYLFRHGIRLRDQVFRLCREQEEIDGRGLCEGRRNQVREGELSATFSGVTFRGRFDRLDILESEALLIDYKSGSSDSYRKSLQLPAYALVMDREGFPPLSGWGYLCLGDGKVVGRFTRSTAPFFGKKAVSPEMLKESLEKARKELDEMAQGLLSGVFPPKWGSEACTTCGYRGLCRMDERPGGSGDGEAE
ncbi:MAG: PD-(D/E)XK nuclease family protein [Thermovirgaceae bacterium]